MPSLPSRLWLAAGALAAVATTAGVAVSLQGSGASAASPRPVVRAPAQLSPMAEPSPAASLSTIPAAGTVTQEPGPFDDRFTLSGTRLSGGVLRTRLRITSDVSDLIDLEVTAAFYDAGGRLLGTARQVVQEGDGTNGHRAAEKTGLDLLLTAEASYAPRVASAVLRVPVLVNE